MKSMVPGYLLQSLWYRGYLLGSLWYRDTYFKVYGTGVLIAKSMVPGYLL